MRVFPTWSLLVLTATVSAQSRVVLGGVPSNLLLDLSSTVVALDTTTPDAFFALMPIVYGATFDFAVFDGDGTMNLTFGSGNWLRCRMVATHWAYLSNDACAHQPGPGLSVPQSVLMTDYDWGLWSGMSGSPQQPWPNSTLFGGSPWSLLQGLPGTFSQERWQLRTRGYYTTDLWNACPGSLSVAPNFNGWLIARFTFVFI